MKIEKETYKKLFNLYFEQKWLKTKEDELLDLLSLCQSLEQQELLWDLLFRFKYLEMNEFVDCLNEIVDHIVNVWKLKSNDTQVVAVTFDEAPDSAQLVLQFLKPLLTKYGWESVKLVNNINRSVKYIEYCPNVILIDEFIGTATTIANRIKHLTKIYTEYLSTKNLAINFEIRVCSIACMEFAKSRIESNGINFFTTLGFKKGISEHYEVDKKQKALDSMIYLESLLDHNAGREEFHSFGWGGAESLYSLQNSNTPNSVFPIFWWKYLSGGALRNTILNRF